jgi:hypothetical protein
MLSWRGPTDAVGYLAAAKLISTTGAWWRAGLFALRNRLAEKIPLSRPHLLEPICIGRVEIS